MIGFGIVVLELAAIALVLMLLNARDERRDRVLATARSACPRALRCALAVHAHARLLGRRVELAFDMAGCDADEVAVAAFAVVSALPRDAVVVISRGAPRAGPRPR